MKQPLIYLLLMLVGGVLGGSVVIVSQFHEQPGELWTTTRELTTENGIHLPAGTAMRVLQTKTEGAVTLELFLNVDDKSLDQFSKTTDSRANLVIPYQVRP